MGCGNNENPDGRMSPRPPASGSRICRIASIASVIFFCVTTALGQSSKPSSPGAPALTCSPAPCVLPPTQASGGGNTVTDPSIVSSPSNTKQLLLGSNDFNCSPPSALGFYLSRDRGSTWKLVNCMPSIITKQHVYWPSEEPSVGYDRNGNAYIGGSYFDSDGHSFGLLAVQKSPDGTHWNRPVIALQSPRHTYPFETSLAVDTSSSSPWVNSVYVSGVMVSGNGGKNQILVSHSRDQGSTWTTATVDSIQQYPEEDDFTRTAVAKDGTVYIVWAHCRGKNGGDGSGSCPTVHMMFSKSTDGGSTWAPPKQIATVEMPPYWLLPNTAERVYNYPVAAVDNSSGPYTGNLYVAMYTWTETYLRAQVIRSTDNGNTWSQPVPFASKSATHDQFFPTLSVSPTGLVGAVWLDRRNDPGDIDYQAFAAISSDGGGSFGTNWQLTQAFSNPRTTGNNWMGDYIGCTWTGSDFIAAWMDSSNGIDMQEVVGGVRLK